MNVPKEFKYLATCFHSRSDLEYASMEAWASTTVQNFLTREDRKIVKQFLANLLSKTTNDDDLQRLWQSLDSDYWFKDGAAVRHFLQLIRAAS